MNIEIANRLVNLRKQNNLSQEALAEKLGISRQAVSKWERAEASPATDNLILLSRLYGITLDELLKTEEEISPSDVQDEGTKEKPEEYVHIGFNGIHVKDEKEEVHVGWHGIHVNNPKDHVDIDGNGVFINGKQYTKEEFKKMHRKNLRRDFPIAAIISTVYIIMGVGWNLWHPWWIMFLLIPCLHSLFSAIEHRNASHFAYPILVTAVFLLLGFEANLWHPGWVLYLTVPIYYSLTSYFHRGHKEEEKEGWEEEA